MGCHCLIWSGSVCVLVLLHMDERYCMLKAEMFIMYGITKVELGPIGYSGFKCAETTVIIQIER